MNLDLEPIKRAAKEASGGPWYWNDSADTDYLYGRQQDGAVWPVLGASKSLPHGSLPLPADAAFIANSRRWIPQLIDEVEELRARLGYYDKQIAAMMEGPA